MSTDSGVKLRAVRGAITVASDEAEEVVTQTEVLLRRVIETNALQAEDIVSIVFTSTPDLTSEFPAAAARRLGLAGVPLLCAVEIDVRGALPRCIRVLVHVYTDRARDELEHPYLGGAEVLLRRDENIKPLPED